MDDPLYPPLSLREALANAFCHRDCAIGGRSVGVAIYDDRLKITSSGSLHFGLTFVDRRKYLIKSGGENIFPAEIERFLLGSRRIADAVIVRKQDAHWGEVPVAFVVRADETLTADDVLALCRGKIANYQLPKEVHFILEADIPRSETSKVKRFELEARLKGA